jgi:hypothetical protein
MLTLNTDTEPTSAIGKSKYLNRMDKALGTIYSPISPNLLFHIFLGSNILIVIMTWNFPCIPYIEIRLCLF